MNRDCKGGKGVVREGLEGPAAEDVFHPLTLALSRREREPGANVAVIRDTSTKHLSAQLWPRIHPRSPFDKLRVSGFPSGPNTLPNLRQRVLSLSKGARVVF